MKKIIAVILAIFMFVTVAYAEGGLIAQVKENTDGIGYSKAQVYAIKVQIESIKNDINRLREYAQEINSDYRFDMEEFAGVYNEDIGAIVSLMDELESRIYQIEIDKGQIESFLAKDKTSIDNLWEALEVVEQMANMALTRVESAENITAVQDYINGLIIDNQALYDMCNEQQAMIADLQAQIDGMYNNDYSGDIATLWEAVNAINTVLYGD